MSKKKRRITIKEASPDHPIYTRNKIYFSPVSKTSPIGTFTLDTSAFNVGTRAGRAALDLIKMWDGPDTLDPIQEYMVLWELPLTREQYLELAYPNGLPENWGHDDELKLPKDFREGHQYDSEEE